MPNSEEYTVVWIGMCHLLQDDEEIAKAEAASHPLIGTVEAVGMEHWFDTFSSTAAGDPEYYLLLGERVDILGHKEGLLQCTMSRSQLIARLDRVDAGLERAGLSERAELHILLRIEE